MSKTAMDVVDILYNYLRDSPVTPNNAQLYKFQRPNNSREEDIVINALPFNRADVQRGLLNLNVYVNDLKEFPDTARLNQRSQAFNEALGSGEEVWLSPDVCFQIQQDNVFKDNNNQHYINFRIDFYLKNK